MLAIPIVKPLVKPLVTSLVRGGGGLDPLVSAFKAESGATDVTGLDNLIKYVRSEGLLNNFVIYPMKADQSAGSGPTVYPLGGLTPNNMTLINSPAWGASGITFNGTTQYGSISDFLGSETLTGFSRVSLASAAPTVDGVVWGQNQFATPDRSIALTQQGSVAGDPFRVFRSSDGGAVNLEQYDTTDEAQTTADQCLVVEWVNGGGRNFWQNKTMRTLSLSTGTPQTSRFNTSVNVTVAAVNPAAPALFLATDYTAFALLTSSITTTQRETITDFINAL